MIRHSSCFLALAWLGLLTPRAVTAQSAGRDSIASNASGGSASLTFTVTPLARSFRVGDYSAAEQSFATQLDAVFRRARVSVSATPLNFSGDTSTSSHSTQKLRGSSALTLMLGIQTRASDTLFLTGRTGSTPPALSPADATALGAVSTAASAFDAEAIGAAPGLSAGYTLSRAIGGGGRSSLHLTMAGDLQPRPADGSQTYWQGSTVRGSVGVDGGGPRTAIRADVAGSRSFSDSLGGNNLFSGGGEVTADVALRYLARADSTVSLTLSGRYTKPFSQPRQEVPSRAIPVGSTLDVGLGLSVQAGSVLIAPGVSWMTENSSAIRRVNNRVSRVAGTGSALGAHVAMVIPIGTTFTLTPDVGGTVGNVSQTVSGAAAPRFGRSARRSGSFSDAVRGFYASVGLTIAR